MNTLTKVLPLSEPPIFIGEEDNGDSSSRSYPQESEDKKMIINEIDTFNKRIARLIAKNQRLEAEQKIIDSEFQNEKNKSILDMSLEYDDPKDVELTEADELIISYHLKHRNLIRLQNLDFEMMIKAHLNKYSQ